ncbi:MAG: hypothetical protein K6T94_16965 [Paenibacillus sp.]|nr:hypothetical protein [Paenibacillus sp.]
MKIDLQYLLDYGDNEIICREAEQYYTYKSDSEHVIPSLPSGNTPHSLFWNFPNRRGRIQPWRQKLWEQQNKF